MELKLALNNLTALLFGDRVFPIVSLYLFGIILSASMLGALYQQQTEIENLQTRQINSVIEIDGLKAELKAAKAPTLPQTQGLYQSKTTSLELVEL